MPNKFLLLSCIIKSFLADLCTDTLDYAEVENENSTEIGYKFSTHFKTSPWYSCTGLAEFTVASQERERKEKEDAYSKMDGCAHLERGHRWTCAYESGAFELNGSKSSSGHLR